MPRAKRTLATKTGRPKIHIDWDKVDEYMQAHLTAEAIADIIGMHSQTFCDRVLMEKGISFTAYSRSKREGGKGKLLHKQYTSAINGNSRMLELLGQEWLGQGKKNNPLENLETQVANVSAAVREIQTERGGQVIIRPLLENEQPLLDQGQGREESKV
jgi:hypothetical protein